jgi:Tfp pilus assembly protein PilE
VTIQRRHRSFTFVELVAATVVLAICLVPATKYLADSMTLRRHLEQERVLVMLAIQTIEEQMAVINGGFTTTQETDTFASQGLPEMAYEIIRTDAASAGGVPGLLMAITVRVWHDENRNLLRDSNEAVVQLHAKMARSIES